MEEAPNLERKMQEMRENVTSVQLDPELMAEINARRQEQERLLNGIESNARHRYEQRLAADDVRAPDYERYNRMIEQMKVNQKAKLEAELKPRGTKSKADKVKVKARKALAKKSRKANR